MSRRVLITGFGPFGNVTQNPAAAIAESLHGRRLRGRTLVGRILPVEFTHGPRELRRLIRETEPELVVCLGVAASRQHITPERVAINLVDAPIPDNAGAQPVDCRISANGAGAYFSTLPIKSIVEELSERGAPVKLSSSAGEFVCNHIFYHLMKALRRTKGIRGGFIHVPLPTPTFGLEAQIEAIRLAISVSLRVTRDSTRVPGRID
ncbi:MAG: pyroglutamyl-peptidase I [Synoicihabitans sp.]